MGLIRLIACQTLVTAVALAPLMGRADSVPDLGYHPHAPCQAPQRPVNDQDDVLWQAFLDDVDRFRSCVNEQMQWHQSQARLHNEHAQETAELWNEFVRTRLNAPADFPHPSQVEETN